jgi:hypothetical protein
VTRPGVAVLWPAPGVVKVEHAVAAGAAPTATASRAESLTINAAALVQGIALVTFPAVSTIFTARAPTPCPAASTG